MRLGVLSDVHANRVALDAVLSDLPDDVDQLVCAGDVVGYNPWPTECIDRVRDECAVVVQGNHDRAVARGEAFSFNSLASAGVRYTRTHLDSEDVEWLGRLPTDETISVGDRDIRLVHGHPNDPDHYTYPGAFDASLLERGTETLGREDSGDDAHDGRSEGKRAMNREKEGKRTMNREKEDPDVLVMGHTHVQAHEVYEAGIVMNPGSVGQPRDGDPRAAYSLVDLDELTVDERRVTYDIDTVVTAVADAGLPAQIGERLRKGE